MSKKPITAHDLGINLDIRGNFERARLDYEVGQQLKDGSIFAGFSPDTGELMFVADSDAKNNSLMDTPKRNGSMPWFAARLYAEQYQQGQNNDWRLPTVSEMKAIMKNREIGQLKDTFADCPVKWAIGYWTNSWEYYSSTQGEIRNPEPQQVFFEAARKRIVSHAQPARALGFFRPIRTIAPIELKQGLFA